MMNYTIKVGFFPIQNQKSCSKKHAVKLVKFPFTAFSGHKCQHFFWREVKTLAFNGSSCLFWRYHTPTHKCHYSNNFYYFSVTHPSLLPITTPYTSNILSLSSIALVVLAAIVATFMLSNYITWKVSWRGDCKHEFQLILSFIHLLLCYTHFFFFF